jgi:hypothetical protein
LIIFYLNKQKKILIITKRETEKIKR